MEPTIYKPSIYNGTGIYKTGAAGGGGGEDFVVFGAKKYGYVQIGSQVWLKEDLALPFKTMSIISPFSSGSDVKAGYSDINGFNEFGLHYSMGANRFLINNKNDIIPGWHVPSRDEWQTLINYCGGAAAAAQKLRSADFGGGEDSFGFNAKNNLSNRYSAWASNDNNSSMSGFELNTTTCNTVWGTTDCYAIRLVKD